MIDTKILENHVLDETDRAKYLRKQILELVKEYTKQSHKSKPFIPGKTLVPASGKVYGDDELQTLISSSLDFWLTAGRYNNEFEKQLSNFLGINFVLTTNSGSSANLLALSALASDELGDKALKPDDEVITAAACFPTTVNPILQNNLVPVFVDVKIPTYNVNPESVKDAITEKTKAIMLAHLLGNPFDVEKIIQVAKKHDLWVIEDCCDALGAMYNKKLVGTFGDIGTLSFYPAHQITMGEGGAIFTNNSKLKRIIESLRDWGRDCFCLPGKSNTCGKRFSWKLGELPEGYDHKYTYSRLGYNLKITEMQAAVGLAQIERVPGFVKKRRSNFDFLKQKLKSVEKFFILPEPTINSKPSWFGFPITIKNNSPFSRKELIEFLSAKMIDTRTLFTGNITRQPYFKNKNYQISGKLENTDIIMNQSFWIGVYPALTEEMLDYVVEQIQQFTNQFS